MSEPTDLRRLHTNLDALHAFVYFRPEAGLNFAALGFEGMDAYFASRAAPMGAVGADVVTATFFNFNPASVAKAIPAAWSTASPETVVETRFRSADQALRTMLGDVVDGPEVARAAELLRRVAEAAEAPGRPLFAANAGLDWPDAPHLQLFHAITLLREYRGDAHVAALVVAGIGPVETLVLDTVAGRSKLPGNLVKLTRGWTEPQWNDGFASLKARGLVGSDEALNDAGLALREHLEEQTDAASLGVWSALTNDEVAEVRYLTRPLVRTVAPQLFGT